MINRLQLYCLIFFLFFGCYNLSAQVVGKTFRVYFIDKAHSPYSLNQPLKFLSQTSIDRRKDQSLPLTETDLPVSPAYLDSLKKAGATVLVTSRWLNSATITIDDSLFLDKIKNFSFLKGAKPVYRQNNPGPQSISISQTVNDISFTESEYGLSYDQVKMLNGNILHDKGFTGKNVIIAVLDAGFYNADSLEVFQNLRARNGILGTKDFVTKNGDVYRYDRHGLYTFSTIGGYLPGKLIGTAPDADYFLIRTENAATEFPIEEDNWVAGLEWADSAGAKVINSSLGYSTFDDPKFNHVYADMDGKTAFSSRAASMAASKGIIVVNSAGNSGNLNWHYITAPSDADNILTVGALDKHKIVAKFSSRGPASDGRVKPDVMAIGVGTVCAGPYGGVIFVNGTSLSAPLITGMVASLWQEFPHRSSFDIMDAVRKSCDKYAFPTDSFGYGIPNFVVAEAILKGTSSKNQNLILEIYPNPFSSQFSVNYFVKEASKVRIALYDAMGKLIQEKYMESEPDKFNKIGMAEDKHLPQGLYLLSITTSDAQMVRKIIRD